MKSNRIRSILSLLLESEDYIVTKELSEKLGVSTRTIFSDIDSFEMQQLLQGATIERRPNVGLKLQATKQQHRKLSHALFKNPEKQMIHSDTDAIAQLIFILLENEQPTTIETLSHKLYRSNITQILESAATYLANFHCELIRKPNFGIAISGDESDIRKLIRTLLLKNLNYEESGTHDRGRMPEGYRALLCSTYSATWIDRICEIVESAEVLMGLKVTDYDFSVLVTKLAVLIDRVGNGYSLTHIPHNEEKPQEYYVAQMIKDRIESLFRLEVRDTEIPEIMTYIMVTRKQVNAIPASPHQIDVHVVEKFIKLLSSYLDVDLCNDTELSDNLLNHLRPAIRRMRYGVSSENPLLNRIKYEYTNIYIAVMASIEAIENSERVQFDSHELGYICLHVVAAINRGTQSRYVNVLLICDDGLSIEAYVQSKIENTFSEINIAKVLSSTFYDPEFQESYDLVINTTNREIFGEKVIRTSISLSAQDCQDIKDALFRYELRKTMHIKDTLKDHVFVFQELLEDRDAILKKYSGFLEIDNYVSPHFYESMMQRELVSPTAMGRGVAVPHGSREHVYSSIVIVIKLNKEILWDDQLVDIIFLTAISTQTDEDNNTFFRKLFAVISDDARINMIRNTNNPSEIETILLETQIGM